MSQPESYNPERSLAEGGRSRRERIMAETAPSLEINSTTAQALPGQGASTEQPNRPWHISPEYDSRRAGEYQTKEEGIYNIIFDPNTGKEVARIARMVGGAPSLGDAWKRVTGRQNQPPGDQAAVSAEQPPVVSDEASSNQDSGDNQAEEATNATAPAEPATTESTGAVHSESTPAAVGGAGGNTGGTERGGGTGSTGGGNGGREGGGNGGPEKPGDPEAPRGPHNPDYIWSPEFRAERWNVVSEIMLWDGEKPYTETYDGGENEEKVNMLYQEWKRLESLERRKSETKKPFSEEDYEVPQAVKERETYPDQDLESIPHVDGNRPADKEDIVAIKEWSERYKKLLETPKGERESTWEADVKNAEEYLSRYFKKAHNVGLLEAVDDSLTSIAKEVQGGIDQGLSPDQIMNGIQESYARNIEGKSGVNKRIEATRELAEETFSRLKKVDPENARRLEGVSRIYIDFAGERLAARLDEKIDEKIKERIPIEGEFKFESEFDEDLRKLLDEGETYWRPNYANYFTVYARTPEQFDRAIETFNRWIRTGLGKEPSEYFQTVDGFNKALTTAGSRLGPEMQEYATKGRRLLMAIVGMSQGSLFNDLYKLGELQQSWNYALQHEGRARMIELAKTSRGKMLAFLKKFGTDKSAELLHSPHGRRGQLMGLNRNAGEMDNLSAQTLAIFTAEALGMSLKEYDPTDPERIIDNGMYRRNLDDMLIFKSDEDYEALYEGYTMEEQESMFKALEEHPVIKQIKFARSIDERIKQGGILESMALTEDQVVLYKSWKSRSMFKVIEATERNLKTVRIIDKQIVNGKTPKIGKRERAIYDEWKAGRLNLTRTIALADLRAWERLDRARRLQKALASGVDPATFEGEDRVMYEETRNAANLAYEIFNAEGEIAQRGGTVFLVDRIKTGKNGKEYKFRDYIPDFWMQRHTQFAENWTKAIYGERLDLEISKRIGRERISPVEYDKLQNDFERIEGQLKNPGLAPLKRQELEAFRQDIDNKLRPKYIPADELFYRYGQMRRMAIWAKRAYGYEAKLWDYVLLRNGKPVDINTLGYTPYGEKVTKKDPIEKYRYAAPVDARYLGYDANDMPIVLVFDDTGEPKTLEFDKEGMATGRVKDLEYDKEGKQNAVIYKYRSEEPILNESKIGYIKVKLNLQNRERLVFDNLYKGIKAVPLLLKQPKEKIDPATGKKKLVTDAQGNVIVDGEDGKGIQPDYETAVNHPYALSTSNPYPGYQEQWTGLMLSDESFFDAREVKAGRMHWKNARPHAIQLLMVDPTLERVAHMDLEEVEEIAVRASQETSYISRWRISDEHWLNFFPADGEVQKHRTQFVLQDHGALMKGWMHLRGEMARWPDMDARRLAPFTPHISLHFASMSQMLGAPLGPFDIFRMYAYGKYPMIGQFAGEKWVNQFKPAQAVVDSVKDTFDEQGMQLLQGLARKLNNEADNILKAHYQEVIKTENLLPKGDTWGPSAEYAVSDETAYQKYLQSCREALKRWAVHFNRRTVLETLFRGERAPKNLEGIEVFERESNGSYKLEDGHRKLTRRVIDNNDSGSSRHSNAWVMYEAAKFLRSEYVAKLYPDVARYFSLLDNRLVDYQRLAAEAASAGGEADIVTGWDWVFNIKENN